MLRQRLITAIILAPTLTYLIYAGGWWYGALVVTLLSIGTWEFIRLAHGSGVVPARWLMLPGVWAVAGGVLWQSGEWLGLAIAALLVSATAWHAWQYEHGAADPLQGWAVTIAAPLYLGVLGGYLLALRALPDGLWWTLTILPAVWVADGGAYMVGRLAGKHKLSVRLSPNKLGKAWWVAWCWGRCLVRCWQRCGSSRCQPAACSHGSMRCRLAFWWRW
ncbi:hypothetical protein EMGBS3_04700 [Anaerolineaceae bacterium]|nr:hypothetical protein EMGBS3_04700 [Anaerolineaceae bacterium]